MVALGAVAPGALADICNYKPSALVGKTATSIGNVMQGDTARAGLQAAGHYSLMHPESALSMVERTVTAAGAVGTIAGSGGVAGTMGAIISAPATIVVGGIALVGVGAFEGACYFKVDKLTDPYEVRKIIESVAASDDAIEIVSTEEGDAMALTVDGETRTYLLRKLYITDGVLKHRDLGPNTNLGPIVYTNAWIEE